MRQTIGPSTITLSSTFALFEQKKHSNKVFLLTKENFFNATIQGVTLKNSRNTFGANAL